MTTSESKGQFFYKTNRFESIRVTNRIESFRIANWNALVYIILILFYGLSVSREFVVVAYWKRFYAVMTQLMT